MLVTLNSDLNQRNNEPAYDWALRVQKLLTDEIQKKRQSGVSINKILLLVPPKFLERLYAVMFACTRHEARGIIFDELRKNGYLQMLGACVISNDSVLYPEIQVLGDIRQAKRETRLQTTKLFGGRTPKP